MAGFALCGLFLLFASAAKAQSATVTYEYDALGRLVKANYGEGGDIAYVYDPNGNRTQVSATASPAGSAQTPYNTQPELVDPGTGLIDYPARQWDFGGQGISFNETTAHHENGGGTWRASDGIESYEPWWTNGSPPPSAVSYTSAGEWMEYTINVAEAGDYEVSLLVAAGNGARQVEIGFDKSGGQVWDQYVGATTTTPGTADWQTFAETSSEVVSLDAGIQVMRLTYSDISTDTASFSIVPAGTPPPTGVQTAFGATSSDVDASLGLVDFPAREWDLGGPGIAFNETETAHVGGQESWRVADGIESYTRSSGPPSAMTYTDDGDWVEYTIDVAQAGDYDVTLLVATGGVRQVDIGFDNTGGQTWAPYQSGTINAQATGGWNTFAETPPTRVTLQAGEQVFRLRYYQSGTDTASFSIVPAGTPPPPTGPQTPYGGTVSHVDPVTGLRKLAIEWDEGGLGVALNDELGLDRGDQNYRSGDGVETYFGYSETGRSAVVAAQQGDWLEYTIDVTQAGYYDLMIEAASGLTGEQVAVSFTDAGASNAYVDATVTLTNTGSWQNFQDSAFVPVSLNAGEQVVRLTYLSANDASDTSSFALMPSAGTPPANNSPVAVDDVFGYQGPTGVDRIWQVLANDSDPDSGDTLTITSVSGAQHGAADIVTGDRIQYLVGADPGIYTDTITYTVSDGNGGTDTATITINLTVETGPTP